MSEKLTAALVRSAGRRSSDNVPVLTKILKDVSILTGAAVMVVYSYGFGQQANDPMIKNREAAQAAEERVKLRQEKDEELRVINLKLDTLTKALLLKKK